MYVSAAMPFTEYWKDPRFCRKRPNMKSSKKSACGDNIYRMGRDGKQFVQVLSYHSCPDGTPDFDKLAHDTKVDRVLVSKDFVYWGATVLLFPSSAASASVIRHRGTSPTSLMKSSESSSHGFAVSTREDAVANLSTSEPI